MKQTIQAPRAVSHNRRTDASFEMGRTDSVPADTVAGLGDLMRPTASDIGKAPFNTLARAQHRTLQEHAYVQIREALMVGRYLPGQKMTIRGLAEALGISPTPIREALHRLTTEGALHAEPNRRLMVPQLSVDEFRELRNIRESLEGLATEQAVPLITTDEIETLRSIDSAIRVLRRAGDISGTIRSIYQFHHTVYAAAHMPTLKHLIEGLWLRSGPYLHLLFPDYAAKDQGKIRAQTMAAIERRDARAARLAMQADLNKTADYLIGLLITNTVSIGASGRALQPVERRRACGTRTDSNERG